MPRINMSFKSSIIVVSLVVLSYAQISLASEVTGSVTTTPVYPSASSRSFSSTGGSSSGGSFYVPATTTQYSASSTAIKNPASAAPMVKTTLKKKKSNVVATSLESSTTTIATDVATSTFQNTEAPVVQLENNTSQAAAVGDATPMNFEVWWITLAISLLALIVAISMKLKKNGQ